MQKNSSLIALATAITAGFVLFSACSKDRDDTETQSATDNGIAENEFSTIYSVMNNVIIREPGTKKTSNLCPDVTVSDSLDPWPHSATLDFGTGCLGDDGRYRTGQIELTIDKPWSQQGSTVNARLVNYTVNGLKCTGTLTAVNQTAKGANQQVYQYKVSDASIELGDGTITWQSTRTLTFLSGFATKDDRTDDIYEITGSSSGTNRKGTSYAVDITTPVHIDGSCKWIPSGVIELTPEGLATRKVDYGDGTCDNKATVTIKGRSYQILLP
ncbi:MAG: hypothetical protein H6585_09575 [Flavobacteriales bacterium]|nr:hypothetical protein [Flavobacteriales bacterium]MCB9448579.1 hypothetical protein [Flavobacteriales bacterium]